MKKHNHKKYFFDEVLKSSDLTKEIPIEDIDMKPSDGKEYISLDTERLFSQIKSGQIIRLLLPTSTGTGKTTAIIDLREAIKEKRRRRFLAIVHRRLLASEVAAAFKITDYQNTSIKHRYFNDLSVCINSLSNVRGKVHFLFIDEIEGVLANLASKQLFPDRVKAENTYSTLLEIIEGAEILILADANIGPLTGLVLKHANCLNKLKMLSAPRKEQDWVYLGSYNKHFFWLLDRIKNGKRLAIACMSKRAAKHLHQFLKKELEEQVEIILLTADSDGIDDFLLERSQKKYICDVLIYSPVIDAGISIKPEEVDKTSQFDEIHLICANSGDGTMAIQLVARVRNPKSTRIYFSGTPKASSGIVLQQSSVFNQDLELRDENCKIIFQEIFPDRFWVEGDAENYKEFLLEFRYQSVQRGLGWVCKWLMVNFMTEDCSKIKISSKKLDEIKIKTEEAHKKCREDRTNLVLQNCSQEEYDELVQKRSHEGRLSYEEECLLENHRLGEMFGDAFLEVSKDERREIIEKDEHKNLSRKIELFTRIRLIDNDNEKALIGGLKKDYKKAQKTAYIHRNYPVIIALNYLTIFDALGVDITQKSSSVQNIIWNRETAVKVRDEAWEFHEVLEAFGIPRPSHVASEPVRFVSSVLKSIGLKQTSKQRRVPKGNGKRIRDYTLDVTYLEQMFERSEHLYQKEISGGINEK